MPFSLSHSSFAIMTASPLLIPCEVLLRTEILRHISTTAAIKHQPQAARVFFCTLLHMQTQKSIVAETTCSLCIRMQTDSVLSGCHFVLAT